MAGVDRDEAAGRSKAAESSNHIVRLMSEYTGRGPTKARTHLSGDVVMSDSHVAPDVGVEVFLLAPSPLSPS
jgi:hypothetical protein